jgi:Protein of unknown function (DUF2865)
VFGERAMNAVSHLIAVACTGVLGGLAAPEAYAESLFCQDLQAQYGALVRQSGGGSGDVQALSRQLWQAQAAAQSSNCNRLFFFLGPPRSPACPAIMATISRLRQQLAGARGQGFLGFASSPDFDRARLRDALIQNGCSIPTASVAGGGRSLCVRTCDGYYFPISNVARRSRTKIDAAVCQSMYAETDQAELYVQPAAADVDQAVSLSGKRYADQPYAFAYRQSYDAACHSELKMGIAALAARYLNAPPISEGSGVTLSSDASDDGALETGPIEASAVEVAPPSVPVDPVQQVIADPNRHVRFVGDAYYAELFDPARPLRPVTESRRRLPPSIEIPAVTSSAHRYPPLQNSPPP